MLKAISKKVGSLGIEKKSFFLIIATFIAQLLPALLSPVLTRIYTPENFGFYSLMLSISGLMVIVFSAKYELAILLPKNDLDIRHVVQLTLSTIVFLTCISIVIASLLNVFGLFTNYYILIIIAIFFSLFCAFYNVASYILIYLKTFKALSINRLLKSVITIVTSIIFGLYFKSINGLIIGALVGQITSTVGAFYIINSKSIVFSSLYKNYQLSNLKLKAIEYSRFPKFSLPSDLINSFISQLPLIIILNYFGSKEAGYFSFVYTVIGLPLTVLSGAILDTFKQRATEEFKLNNSCIKAYKSTFLLLFIIGVLPTIIILIWGQVLFSLIFGSNWSVSGTYASILMIMFFIKFLSSPLSYTFILANKQKLDFKLHLIMMLLVVLTIVLCVLIFKQISFLIWGFTISFSFVYLVYLILSYKFAK